MGEFVLKNGWLGLGGYFFDTGLGDLVLKTTTEAKEYVCFQPVGELYKKRLPGVGDADIAMSGYWNVETIDAALKSGQNVTNTLALFGPTSPAAGSIGFLLRVMQGEYSLGGSVGEVTPFSVTAMGSAGSPERLGKVLHYGAVSASGDGTSVTLGAVDAEQKLYVGLAVTGKAGTSPTLDVVHETSALGDYTDAVTLHTFAQFTDRDAAYVEIAGPITDTHHRLSFTLGGSSSPSFPVVCVAAIE
ncbi:MAG TPA: hypothetical protein VLT87_10985 [Thermoanaerobaculia bacterium]|nr:hypothetical protein [Thermoanaerobaculia bacterium]